MKFFSRKGGVGLMGGGGLPRRGIFCFDMEFLKRQKYLQGLAVFF